MTPKEERTSRKRNAKVIAKREALGERYVRSYKAEPGDGYPPDRDYLMFEVLKPGNFS